MSTLAPGGVDYRRQNEWQPMAEATNTQMIATVWIAGLAAILAMILLGNEYRGDPTLDAATAAPGSLISAIVPERNATYTEENELRAAELQARHTGEHPSDDDARRIRNRKVAEALSRAQTAIADRDWNRALAEIDNAAASGATPFEAIRIDEFRGFVLIQQKQFQEATMLFERMLASGSLSPQRIADLMNTIATLYFQQQNYAMAAHWIRKYLAARDDENMRVLLAQSYYLANDYDNAAATMKAHITRMQRARRVPAENHIAVLLAASQKVNDDEGVKQATVLLQQYYPR